VTWELYRWTWRVVSPLFIGTTPSGALNRCRVYVPARPLWGAITAELARLEGDKEPQYRQVGDALREHAGFSYLFPAERGGDDWPAWLPEYREGAGLVWAREGCEAVLADRNIRRQLLGTRPATAVDPDSDSALDGSLRETECVQTSWRRGEGTTSDPVAMVGYVFVRRESDLAQRLPALDRIFLGGDTRYGLGRLDRVAMTRAPTLFGATVDLGQANPHVVASRVLAHVLFHEELPMCGEQEALGGWDMTGHQQDRRISGPAWTPGSRPLDGRSRTWAIVESGMARLADGSA
jgi:hypothetical protein